MEFIILGIFILLILVFLFPMITTSLIGTSVMCIVIHKYFESKSN